MTSLDITNGVRTVLTRLREAWEWYDSIPPVRKIHSTLGQVADGWRRISRWINSGMPKGLYARALLIIIAPMVILQSVIAFVFMERHWNVVTQRLSASVVQDIAALIDIYRGYPQDADQTQIRRIAQDRLGLVVDFLPLADMPPPGPKPFFSLLDQALSDEDRHRRQIGTAGNPGPARQHSYARFCASKCCLRLQFGNLPAMDGRHLDGAVDCRDHFSA